MSDARIFFRFNRTTVYPRYSRARSHPAHYAEREGATTIVATGVIKIAGTPGEPLCLRIHASPSPEMNGLGREDDGVHGRRRCETAEARTVGSGQ